MQKTSIDPGPIQPLLTIAQVAKILGVSRPTVYSLIYKEGLPVVKLSKHMRIISHSLQQWIAEREQR
jgi:excisionase family DNA binding protein